MMLLGTAFQRQLIPIELEPLQLALKQMVPHADLDTNMKAFTVGRRLALKLPESAVGSGSHL